MVKNIIVKVLKAYPMKFTLSIIERIMNKEMAKDPSKMDGDLIDLCIDILSKHIKYNSNEEYRPENYSKKKTVIIDPEKNYWGLIQATNLNDFIKSKVSLFDKKY